ncbi:hypothetical protein PTQ21_12250 [Paenibacillus marchantiae]|uniref:hypothetical protein n=1 Tax=Paenibacillus marchantiae TaxID=3026433 RepID=UPI00237A64DB|nr:hypothetical protein [Paenibacillus marchantiae]WDQ34961.1 hypothetical protein PTQ21_12250 [Paenibacillus marchantiae]
MRERTKSIFNHGEDNEIVVEGNSEIFGGVDLQVSAITAMLENLDFKFANDHLGNDYADKAFTKILDSMGRALKAETEEYPDGMSNIEFIQYYLKFMLEEDN